MILESKVEKIADLLLGLDELSRITGADEVLWFRGHAKETFELLPSIARYSNGVSREALLSKRFKQNAYPYRDSPPQGEWEWLFLMQHFGVPTRLLDWTESPLTALYFCVNDKDESHEALDAKLWALLPVKFNHEIPRIRPQVSIDIPCFGVDGILDDYRPDRISLESMTSKLPVAAIANRQNERIVAQMGVFTVMHRDQTPLEQLAPQFLATFKIPANSKRTIRQELTALRVTNLTLFPELSSVASVATEVLR